MTASGPDAFRARFPVLIDRVYLASCSAAPRSVDMDAAVASLHEAMDKGLAWEAWEAQVEQARVCFAGLIGARPDQIAVLPSASVAAYQVASGMLWWHRPQLLSCLAEFPGIAHVWAAQAARGAEPLYAGRPDQPISTSDYLTVLSNRVGLVSIPAVTFRDGVRLRVDRVAAAAHAAGAQVLVDAYQAVGVEPVDVDAWDCDWLIAGASKYLCGKPGAAFLYARDPILPRSPRLTGWLAQQDPFGLTLDWRTDARRLETGTPAVDALYAATAGLTMIATLDLHAVREHVSGLLDYATAQLIDAGETIASPSDSAQRGAHLAIVDTHPGQLAAFLARDNVIVAPRQHVVRLAAHYFSSRSDVDAACAAIRRFRAAVRPAQPIPSKA